MTLLGYWNLIKFEAIADDGSVIYPYGKNVRGMLHYADNEIMSAQLGDAMRANFVEQDFRNAKPDEIIEAFRNYIAYFGKYSINENRKYIIHEIEMSLFPNWIGTRVKRNFELNGDILILSANKLDYDGVLRTPTLTWQKIKEIDNQYRWHS